MKEIYIFGHRNPDTDSVTSAITLSHLKNKLGMKTIPAVLSSINLESKFALNYFNTPEPIFLNDIDVKIKDLPYYKNSVVSKDDSIYEAYYKMNKFGISKIPVVDNDKILLGVLSMKDIAKEQFTINNAYICTSYDNICEVIKGKKITIFDDIIEGEKYIVSNNSSYKGKLLIANNDINAIKDAINDNVKLIIITDNYNIDKEIISLAKDKGINIITSPYTVFEVNKVINLCNFAAISLCDEEFLSISENDDINDLIKIANRTRFNYYPVLNKDSKCTGIIKLSDVGFNNKQDVILVDHNSYEQSAIGLNRANILEIIDHHNIGALGTNMPISFRNMPVGSTNTIIYLLYKENRISISKNIAGLMLSGILSDTLILKSPTTTDYDKEAVKFLSKIAKVNYKEYGYKMIKAGSSLKGMTKEQVLYKDYKNYTIGNSRIGLGQIITTDIEEIMKEKDEYIKILNTTSESNNYSFLCLFVTDILKNGTYVFYSERAKDILELAFNIDNIAQGEFLKSVISRKQQILPHLINNME